MKVTPDNNQGYSIASITRKKESLPHEKIIEKRNQEEKLSDRSGAKIKADNNISDDEKIFFADLYPMNKNEIMNYHYYQKSGKPSGIVLGSLFDKRG